MEQVKEVRYPNGTLKACSKNRNCPLKNDCKFWTPIAGRCSWSEEDDNEDLSW